MIKKIYIAICKLHKATNIYKKKGVIAIKSRKEKKSKRLFLNHFLFEFNVQYGYEKLENRVCVEFEFLDL